MVCDRVAILNHGQLEKVGVLEEMLAGTEERVHLLVQDLPPDAMQKLLEMSETHQSMGKRINFVLREAQLKDALGTLLEGPAQVLSVSRERESLEDFFVRQTGGAADGA